MKTGKYLAGGLIKGLAGKGIKSFMKSGIYKDMKKDLSNRMNKMYGKSGDKGLKKLDTKYGKANIIQDALTFTAKNKKGKLTRRMQASMLVGARNLEKYKKKLGKIGNEYMKKRMSKKKDN